MCEHFETFIDDVANKIASFNPSRAIAYESDQIEITDLVQLELDHDRFLVIGINEQPDVIREFFSSLTAYQKELLLLHLSLQQDQNQ